MKSIEFIRNDRCEFDRTHLTLLQRSLQILANQLKSGSLINELTSSSLSSQEDEIVDSGQHLRVMITARLLSESFAENLDHLANFGRGQSRIHFGGLPVYRGKLIWIRDRFKASVYTFRCCVGQKVLTVRVAFSFASTRQRRIGFERRGRGREKSSGRDDFRVRSRRKRSNEHLRQTKSNGRFSRFIHRMNSAASTFDALAESQVQTVSRVLVTSTRLFFVPWPNCVGALNS
jgi:hypothetical protein